MGDVAREVRAGRRLEERRELSADGRRTCGKRLERGRRPATAFEVAPEGLRDAGSIRGLALGEGERDPRFAQPDSDPAREIAASLAAGESGAARAATRPIRHAATVPWRSSPAGLPPLPPASYPV